MVVLPDGMLPDEGSAICVPTSSDKSGYQITKGSRDWRLSVRPVGRFSLKHGLSTWLRCIVPPGHADFVV